MYRSRALVSFSVAPTDPLDPEISHQLPAPQADIEAIIDGIRDGLAFIRTRVDARPVTDPEQVAALVAKLSAAGDKCSPKFP